MDDPNHESTWEKLQSQLITEHKKMKVPLVFYLIYNMRKVDDWLWKYVEPLMDVRDIHTDDTVAHALAYKVDNHIEKFIPYLSLTNCFGISVAHTLASYYPSGDDKLRILKPTLDWVDETGDTVAENYYGNYQQVISKKELRVIKEYLI